MPKKQSSKTSNKGIRKKIAKGKRVANDLGLHSEILAEGVEQQKRLNWLTWWIVPALWLTALGTLALAFFAYLNWQENVRANNPPPAIGIIEEGEAAESNDQ